jgi:uncharacterized protein DUF3592
LQLAFRIMGLAGRLLFALGIVCLLLGGWLAWNSLKPMQDAVQTTGKVVSYREIAEGDSKSYRPRIRFRTLPGNIVTIEGPLMPTSTRFAVGDDVPVIYPRMEPTKARLDTYVDNWLGATIAAIVGVVSFIAGLLIRRAVARDLARARA